MGKVGKSLALALVLVMVISSASLLMIKPANAQTPTPTPTPTPPTTTKATGNNGSLELSISISKTVYPAGEPVNAIFVLTNIGNKTVDIFYYSMTFDLQEYNGNNTLVYDYFRTQAFSQVGVNVQLNSGDSVNKTLTWNQTFQTNPSTNPTQASSGIYYMVGSSYGIQTEPLEILIVGTTSTTSPTSIPTATSSSPTSTPSVPELSAVAILTLLIAVSISLVVMLPRQSRQGSHKISSSIPRLNNF